MKTRDLVQIGLFAAIICVFAPFSLPINVIPISLVTFAIYLAAGVLGAKKGTAAVVIYILLGAIGLPVFSGFGAGIGKIMGVTGGYIIGYVPCAYISGAIIDKFSAKKPAYVIAFVVGTAVLYAFGTAWFMVQSGNGLAASLTTCVIPFLAGDAVKIACATVLSVQLRKYEFAKIA
ncbi:MAG: biotin transporter BioY [Clostridiales bacterium]|nr:biotin transporter BioY [Clostridiales bacterium]